MSTCRVYWGSHGCVKPAGHEGEHLCFRGCIPYPPDGENVMDDRPIEKRK